MIINSFFYFFSCVLLVSSLMIIFSQNSIYSVLFLVLSFVSSSSVLFLLECEYISLIFILIYVGAIAVLFLFVVMMLDIKTIYLPNDIFCRIHKPSDSIFSWSSGFNNYEGVVNWAFLLLTMGGVRLGLENLNK